MNEKRISEHYTDENVVRIIAAQVTAISIAALATFWVWLALLLITDFAIRGFTKNTSPLAAIAKTIAKQLGLKPQPIFATPKKFAATLGFIFTLTATVLFLLKLPLFAYLVSGVLITCAILESVFKICVGCYVFDWFVAPVLNTMKNKKRQAADEKK